MGLKFSQTKSPSASATFTNPVINSDFPDPNCIKVKDTFYAFATNFGELSATSSHIQLATSTDLVNFKVCHTTCLTAFLDASSWA